MIKTYIYLDFENIYNRLRWQFNLTMIFLKLNFDYSGKTDDRFGISFQNADEIFGKGNISNCGD